MIKYEKEKKIEKIYRDTRRRKTVKQYVRRKLLLHRCNVIYTWFYMEGGGGKAPLRPAGEV